MAMSYRKRKTSAPSRYGKKRRVGTARRRLLNRRRSKATDISSRSTVAVNTGIRSRRLPLSKRAYRNLLWRDSLLNTKWKTINSATGTLATPASLTSGVFGFFETMDNSNPFWTAAGGLQAADLGAGVAVINPENMVIRGGRLWISISAPAAVTEDVRVTIQLIYAKQNVTRLNSLVRTNIPTADWIASLPALPQVGYKVQNSGDYDQFFHQPIRERTIILKPGDSFEDTVRLRVKRIDRHSFVEGKSAFPRYVVYVSNIATAVAQTLRIQTGYNMSFTADAV